MPIPDPYLPGHGDTRHRVRHYDLTLDYKVATNRLDETAVLDVEMATAASSIELDLFGLNVDRLLLDGRKTKYVHKGSRLHVQVGDRKAGERFRLTIGVSGKPRPMPGVHGEAGWEELTDGAMVGSQPQGAPSWFPCNDDAADKATYTITVTTESAYAVVANGSLVATARVGGRTRWTYEMPTPMAPYLATVQIGRYATTPVTSRVPTLILHPRALKVGEGTAFAHQGAMVDLFCDLFGPYPFAEYRAVVVDDVLEIPLEAQGLSSFGRNFATNTWDHERLVAHELAHQWFGNSLTATQLSDIWLHEGFACYAEWLWSDHRAGLWGGLTVQEQAAKHHAELPTSLGRHTLISPGVRQMFDDWVYKRGALTLHAVRAELGEDGFFALLRRWAAEHAGGLVTTDDFVDACTRAAGRRSDAMASLLHEWLEEPTLPVLPVLD